MKKTVKVKTLVIALASAGLASIPGYSLANPTGGQVVAGNATIRQESATKVGITQTTDKAIIDWQKFSIGTNEHVQYYQPSATSVTLNRVVGQDPSQILGRLTANGQVFLVNPNGIYFGKNAQIDVAGLVASTHNIRNEDFMAGKYLFNMPGKPGASVINEGQIRISDTGIAAFVAPSVANRGVIAAKLGKVALASANGFTLDFHGDELLTFMVDDEVAKTAFDLEGNQLTSFVENSGKIEAQGGYVLLTAKATENAIHGVINHSGAIEATTVGQQNGEIILHAGNSSLVVSGVLDASAPSSGDGGFIETSGGVVDIAPSAKITTASSMGNTGKWLIDPTDYFVQASGGNITGAQLSSYLNSNNVEIQTLSIGSGLGNININDAVTWTSLNKLTLTAHRDINITQAVNASGGGSIKLRADSLGSGTGKVNFSGSGQLYVTNGAAVSIFYNPSSYTGSDKSDTTGNPYSSEVTRTNGATLTAYMLVNNVTQLQAMKDRPSGYYALGKDIYANGTNGSLNTATWNGGKGFIPVGTNAQTFSGRFFGDDHKIIGLYINDNTLLNAGLFGVIGVNGRVSHVGLESASVTGSGDAGILAGQNFGNITKAYAVGSVTGDSAGGLTGRNWGAIAQAFSSGSVTGLLGGSVGGLTSNNSGSISNSFSTSTVNLTFDDCGPLCQIGAAGALVAANMGGATITNSYATGLLTLVGTASPTSNGLMGMGIDFGSTTSSHWNTQTTGQATSPGGTGKTTAQMTQQGTFVGWDFGDIWNIDEGVGFPYLKWSNLVFNDPRIVLTPTPGGSSTSEGNRVSQMADICALSPVICRPELAPVPPFYSTLSSNFNESAIRDMIDNDDVDKLMEFYRKMGVDSLIGNTAPAILWALRQLKENKQLAKLFGKDLMEGEFFRSFDKVLSNPFTLANLKGMPASAAVNWLFGEISESMLTSSGLDASTSKGAALKFFLDIVTSAITNAINAGTTTPAGFLIAFKVGFASDLTVMTGKAVLNLGGAAGGILVENEKKYLAILDAAESGQATSDKGIDFLRTISSQNGELSASDIVVLKNKSNDLIASGRSVKNNMADLVAKDYDISASNARQTLTVALAVKKEMESGNYRFSSWRPETQRLFRNIDDPSSGRYSSRDEAEKTMNALSKLLRTFMNQEDITVSRHWND